MKDYFNLKDRLFQPKHNHCTYKVIDIGKMKHPDTRKWLFCVIYKRIKKDSLPIYSRELNDFISKFEEIEKT